MLFYCLFPASCLILSVEILTVNEIINLMIWSLNLRYSINWNYGLLPQTWEDPSHANPEVEGAFGDNDPGISSSFILTFYI